MQRVADCVGAFYPTHPNLERDRHRYAVLSWHQIVAVPEELALCQLLAMQAVMHLRQQHPS